MSPTVIGILGLIALFVLLGLRMPVAIAMMVVGFVGTGVLDGWRVALSGLSDQPLTVATFFSLSVIPLLVLMGNLAGVSGMSRDLYAAAYAWVGGWRGGLASSTIVGCAGFAALSGPSLASAVTMGRVALPEMRRYNYSDRLATGCVAAGGTLGILIPPSTGFVIYAVLTEESIGRLFIAGILPGIMLTALFVVAITLITRVRPDYGPAGPRTTWVEKFAALGRAGPIAAIVLITIGGIYGGIFTPVEAAGVGAALALVMAVVRRSLDVARVRMVVLQTMRTTGTSFLILMGAFIFNPFIARTGIPGDLAALLVGLNIGDFGVLVIILVTFVVLGTFLEGLAMLVLMLPIVVSLIEQMGLSLVWFGVVMVIVLEMGLISPPVGVNVFVVKGIAEDVPMSDIFKGILPFWLAMGVALIILVAVPEIATILPNTMFGNPL